MPLAIQGKSQRHQAVIYAFWKSWQLADKVWLDGESYSCFFTPLFFLASTPIPTSFKSPSSARRFSLRAAVSTLYLSSFLPTIAVLRWGLSEPALFIRHARMQWMTMTSVVTCHALHALQHTAASLFGPLNQSHDFLRPSCRSRLYITWTRKSRFHEVWPPFFLFDR